MATITVPDNATQAALKATRRNIRRAVRIFESDGVTPYDLNPGFVSFEISVDAGRDERRSLTLQLRDEGKAGQDASQLWYDKIIKCYRGYEVDGSDYLPVVGTFLLDRTSRTRNSNLVQVTGRDLSKKLAYEFGEWVEFDKNTPLENVIRDIALAGGLPASAMNLPLTGINIDTELAYQPSAFRWSTMHQLADSYNFDLYFDPSGVMQMEEHPRLVGDPIQWTFETGTQGNIGSDTRDVTDGPIRNKVIVIGNSDDSDSTPPSGSAINQSAGNTSVDRIGLRPVTETRTELTSSVNCQALAERLLENYTKERFDISAEILATPWLEANILVVYDREDADDFDEVRRYILESFTISSAGGLMPAQLSRLQTDE